MASSSMCKAVTPVTASRAIQTKAAAVHSCAKRQNPAKYEIKKIREIDGSYLCLLRFDKFCISSAKYDRKQKLCELAET